MNGEIFHVLNRGVDKRTIFVGKKDYLRFIHNLHNLNDENQVANSLFRFKNKYEAPRHAKTIDIASRYNKTMRPLVEIYAFCLMNNHYHLMLTPLVENGLSRFMKKINIAYAKYFNVKYQRKGHLFEGRYKSIHLKKESHFIHLPYYIHFNPLDIQFHNWRDRNLSNHKAAIKFLETYRWSSHLDYLRKENFPEITKRKFLWDFFGGPKGYREQLYSWLRDISKKQYSGLTLE